MKSIAKVTHPAGGHWVGDGFPVRSLFGYNGDTAAISPFLLFDHAGPHHFEPNSGRPRGVGQHPHRGFETVTIVYEGEVSHADSAGGGGTIGPGDVQWMTAAGGIIHEEFHSAAYSRTGGPFHMVQLWVNLPARDKMSPARYQAITASQIPQVALEGGQVRVIAGEFGGAAGPASTFTPINLWDVRLEAGAHAALALPEGHNAMAAVLTGRVTIGSETLAGSDIAHFTREGSEVVIKAQEASTLLILTGEPIDEPVVGYGPFVMTSEAEIHQAIADFNSGRFGRMNG